jgi:hypothetical protein
MPQRRDTGSGQLVARGHWHWRGLWLCCDHGRRCSRHCSCPTPAHVLLARLCREQKSRCAHGTLVSPQHRANARQPRTGPASCRHNSACYLPAACGAPWVDARRIIPWLTPGPKLLVSQTITTTQPTLKSSSVRPLPWSPSDLVVTPVCCLPAGPNKYTTLRHLCPPTP